MSIIPTVVLTKIKVVDAPVYVLTTTVEDQTYEVRRHPGNDEGTLCRAKLGCMLQDLGRALMHG